MIGDYKIVVVTDSGGIRYDFNFSGFFKFPLMGFLYNREENLQKGEQKEMKITWLSVLLNNPIMGEEARKFGSSTFKA